jgi:phosphoglycerate dehydrogenase-like enzyme
MKLLTTARFKDADLESLRSIASEVEVIRETDPAKAAELLRDADIFCGYDLPAPLEDAKKLKWIQLVSAGAEHMYKAGIRESDVLVTTASGVHVHAMAEYALCAMVMLARRIPQILDEIDERKWRPQRPRFYYGEELHGKTVGVLGLGAIGQQVATTSRCLGMKVLGLRRSGGSGVADEVFTPDRLLEMLPQCDFVVVALPLTKETTNLIGERELKAMKKSAHLVNMARGRIVDETSLVRALREGWIAGAAVDAFAQEPLPSDSEMWDVPNLMVTPHVAGNFLAYLDRVMDILRDNLRRYLAGEAMINVLDKQRGY